MAINATVVVNSSSDSGPAFHDPAYAGQGGLGSSSQGRDGSGTMAASHGRRHKKHPKPLHPGGHLTHAVGKHPAGHRPGQVAVTPRRAHPEAAAPSLFE
jgi:hypothetical protein